MLSRKRSLDPQDFIDVEFILAIKRPRVSDLRDSVQNLSSHRKESSFLWSFKDFQTRRYSRETILSLWFVNKSSSEIKQVIQAVHDSGFLDLASSPSRSLRFVNRSSNRVIQINSFFNDKLSCHSNSSSDSIKLKYFVFRRFFRQIDRKKEHHIWFSTQKQSKWSVLSSYSLNTHQHLTHIPPHSHLYTHNMGPIPFSTPNHHDPSILPTQKDHLCPTRTFESSFCLHPGLLHEINPDSDLSSDISGFFPPRQGSKQRRHDIDEMQMEEWRIIKKR